MAKIVIEGITFEQAVDFASWYVDVGSRRADEWFESESMFKAPQPYNVGNGWHFDDKDEQVVTIPCK
jgi:hypothetical protein